VTEIDSFFCRDFKMLKQAQRQTQDSVYVFSGCPFDRAYYPLCHLSWFNYKAEYVIVLHWLRPFKFSRLFQECRVKKCYWQCYLNWRVRFEYQRIQSPPQKQFAVNLITN
jgi:hypothetical protein